MRGKHASILLVALLLVGWFNPFDAIATELRYDDVTREYDNVDADVTDGFVREDIEPERSSISSDDSNVREEIMELERIIRDINSGLDKEYLDKLVRDAELFDEKSVREELERIDVKWDDLPVWDEKSTDGDLSDWEDAIREYDRLVAEGMELFSRDRSFEELEGKMMELIREISANEPDLERIASFGDPREEGVVIDEIFRITEIFIDETIIGDEGVERATGLMIRGTGPPDSTVVLFIYSTPIMVSTRTDSEGNWTYLLERELEDGSHEVYVASVDNTGRILAKSKPAPFVKEAAAIQVDLLPLPGGEFSALGFFEGKVITILIAIFALIVATTIVLVGIAVGKGKNSQQ